MTREELKNKAVQMLGYEHPKTIAIFTVAEDCKDDLLALTLMEIFLLEGLGEYSRTKGWEIYRKNLKKFFPKPLDKIIKV